MKNNALMKALTIVAAVVLLAAAGMKLLPFARAEQYHVGDGEISAAIRELKIDWTSGKVHIAYDRGATIRVRETTTGLISESMRMRWIVEGDTLRIEYEQPGFHLFSLLPHGKELTVTLPEELTLEKAHIAATSAELDIPALYADSAKLITTSGDIRANVTARRIEGDMTSGNMELTVLRAADEIRLHSTSGSILLESDWAAGNTVIGATSGTIRAAVRQAGEFKASATSGNISVLLGTAGKAKLEATSGKITLETGGVEALEINTTSGSVTAHLPAAPGFTARVHSTSGNFACDLPLTRDGNTYIAGDGSAKVEIQTTSGNVKISALEK